MAAPQRGPWQLMSEAGLTIRCAGAKRPLPLVASFKFSWPRSAKGKLPLLASGRRAVTAT